MPPYTDFIVEARLRGGLSGWRGALLFVGGWSVYGPLAVWLLGEHLRLHPSSETVQRMGLVIATAGIIGTWTICHFSYFAVAPAQLQIGRSPRETVIEFSEIESIVEGLPAQQSLLMRMGGHGEMAGALAMIARMRKEALLLRLTGGRFLAFYVSPFYFANVDEVRMTLLERNRNKVLARDSYTPEEIKRLGSVRFNVIGKL
jgi:hypothetical protein